MQNTYKTFKIKTDASSPVFVSVTLGLRADTCQLYFAILGNNSIFNMPDKMYIITCISLLTGLIVYNGLLVNAVSIEKDLSLTLKEKQALDKFREQVTPLLYKEYMKTDIYLIRWLRAKRFDVNDAEAMLKENIRWRLENKIDQIQSENFTLMFQEFPATVDTYDKQGRPIGVIDINFWDIRNAILAGRGRQLLHYLDMLMDNVTMQVFEQQRKGLNVAQWVVLSNTDGFNMINHGCPVCIPVWVQFVSSLENHFPGWMHEFMLIESPLAVHTIIEILKPLLSQQTRDTFRVFSSNKQQWTAYLDQYINRDERRPAYGGTKPEKIYN